MYSNEIKESAIQKLNKGISVGEVSQEMKISKSTLYKWKEEQKGVPVVSQEDANDIVPELPSNEEKVACDDIPVNIPSRVHEVAILRKQGKYIEALKICDNFPDNSQMQNQKAILLGMLGRYDEGIETCDKFPTNKLLQSQKATLLKEKAKKQNTANKNTFSAKARNISNTEDKYITSNIFTRIYCDDITLEEIKSAELPEFKRVVLLIAYYDKNNRKQGIQFIKEQKKLYDDEEKVKCLNILQQRLLNKKVSSFNYPLYTEILHCSLNLKLVEEITARKEALQVDIPTQKAETVSVKKNTEPSAKRIKSTSSSMISFEGVKSSARHIESTKQSIDLEQVHEQKQSINTKSIENPKELLIKDIFSVELEEIGKYIYVEMGKPERQKRAIQAWDKLENWANQPVSNQKVLIKVIDLLHFCTLFGIENFNIDEKRYTKYLVK